MVSLELQVLGWAALLWAAQLVLLALAANLQLGPRYLLGPRDEARPLQGRAGRLQRALANHGESLLLFAVAVLLVELGGRASALTAACAQAYLAARLIYLPAYAFGLAPWRSLIWGVGFAATLVMLGDALIP